MHAIFHRLLTLLILGASLMPRAMADTGPGITISREQASLPDLFLEIHQQTGYFFYYNEEDLAGARKVNIHVVNATLEIVLGICFANQPLRYELSDHTIIVKMKVPASAAPAPLQDIRGQVKDESGEPVVGGTVAAGARATSTDKDGHFELHGIAAKASSVEISSVGYESQSIPINGRVEFTVVLKRSVSKLDDVQVIAYGTTTERLATGSVSTVKAETIAQQPVSNPLAAMEGRVAGLFITENTGVPGGSFSVQVRGRNSIASGNNPLYVIDGVPFTSTPIGSAPINAGILDGGNPLSSINPSDIESIEILKDADATAIYGSRGANGIVLITTKKGKAGKTKLDINLNQGFEHVAHYLKLEDTKAYLEMRREAFTNDNATPDRYNAPDLLLWDTSRYTDWQKVLIGNTAETRNVQLSLSGGNANTQFLVAAALHDETTVFLGDFSDRKASVHLNLINTSENQKFKTNISVTYLHNTSNLLSQDFALNALALPPDAPPLYNNLGRVNWDSSGAFYNPAGNMLMKYKGNTDNLVSNALFSYQLLPGLQISARMGYTKMQVNELTTTPLDAFNPLITYAQAGSSFAVNNIETWNLEPQALWSSKIGLGKLDVLIGTTLENSQRNGQTLYATGFSSDAMLENIAAASSITTSAYAPPVATEYHYAAAFGRINFNWQEKYLLNLTARRDGSSRFGPGKQFANFGAIGAAWIFSNSRVIIKYLPVLSFGKIRGSYGVSGNDQIPDYGFLDTYGVTAYGYNQSAALFPTGLANPQYGWESNKKWELALEMGFLKDRLLLSVNFYRNRSSNQLVGYHLPAITGFSTIQSNLQALVQNRGIELELTTINLKGKALSWSSSFNFTLPENKLLFYPGLSSSSYADRYAIGKSLSLYKAFQALGVDPATGVYQFQSTGSKTATVNPAYPDDLQGQRELKQYFYGGLSNAFTWKGFQIDFFLQFVKQNGKNYLANGFDAPGTFSNQPALVMDRWRKPGDEARTQKFTQDYGSPAYSGFINAVYNGDNVVGDASYLRLKNAAVSYHLKKAMIYLQGQNLLTITHYQGADPENQNGTRVPPLRTITAGIQVML